MEAAPQAGAPAGDAPHGALRSTLGVASSAASLVLYPYVAAGRAAYRATSFAVSAPLKLSQHVISSAWQPAAQSADAEDMTATMTEKPASGDLFGEQDARRRMGEIGDGFKREADDDLFGEREQEDEEDENEELVSTVTVEIVASSGDEGEHLAVAVPRGPSAVTQLLFLPVRLVSTGVSTAVAIPSTVVAYSGRKIAGAVSTSTELVARTSLHVAQGITHSAVSTASFTATKVSDAMWLGLGATGNASASLVSYAIAVPSYRMLRALVPDVTLHWSEQDAVDLTRGTVLFLVRVLGPQNAFYILKHVYEAVNSEEAHDTFLLCQDVAREALDGDNYRKAGASVGHATGAAALVPVVKALYNMLPSVDEMLDAVAVVEDVSNEARHALKTFDEVSKTPRFEYLEEDEVFSGSDSDRTTSLSDVFDEDDEELQYFAEINCDEDASFGGESGDDDEWMREKTARASAADAANVLVESGISFLTKVSDSPEVASLFNTFGDFLDVLVE